MPQGVSTCRTCTLMGTPCPWCFWMTQDPPEPNLYAQEMTVALNSVQTELIHRQDPHYLADKRLAMAFDLAPDRNTCIALMLGERVPIEQLDPEAVTRYGLRRQDAA